MLTAKKFFAKALIRSFFSRRFVKNFAQTRDLKVLLLQQVENKKINQILLNRRNMKRARSALILMHNLHAHKHEDHAKRNILVPYLDKRALFFNLKT